MNAGVKSIYLVFVFTSMLVALFVMDAWEGVNEDGAIQGDAGEVQQIIISNVSTLSRKLLAFGDYNRSYGESGDDYNNGPCSSSNLSTNLISDSGPDLDLGFSSGFDSDAGSGPNSGIGLGSNSRSVLDFGSSSESSMDAGSGSNSGISLGSNSEPVLDFGSSSGSGLDVGPSTSLGSDSGPNMDLGSGFGSGSNASVGLGSMNRVGEGGYCSKDNIEIMQGATDPLPNGIPTYTVIINNVCVSNGEGCSFSNIHVSCGWFASARMINPNIFRRLGYDDCLLNNGEPLNPGDSLSFSYANTYPYPLSITFVSC